MAYSYPVNVSDSSAELFKTTFKAPLPMAGSAISKLSDVPTCSDLTTFRGSTREVAITSWNTQCHHYPTSIGYTRAVPVTTTQASRHVRETILTDGALAQVVAKISQINAVTRRRLLSGKNLYLTSNGVMVQKLPNGYTSRSSTYSDATATNIARACDEGRPANQPPDELPGSSETGETPAARTGDRRSTSPSGDDAVRNVVGAATKPSKSKESLVVPVREVKTVAMMFKGFEPAKPPRSPAYTAIESYATNSDRAATQPYLSAARGVLARDVPAIQEIVSYVSAYNASYIDTAPILRGLLYVYPRPVDVWNFDSFDARFVRRLNLPTRIRDGMNWHRVPAAERLQVRLVAVTLPAFSAHLKNLDPGMAAEGANGVALSGMDTAWAAVPVSSDILGSPWLREYLLTFLSTALWAGRSCVLSHGQVTTDAQAADVKYSGMPAAHQVHIPGPMKLVLVLIDENTYAQALTINIEGIGNMNVYRGTRIAAGEAAFNTFWVNAQNPIYDLFTADAYPASCQNMVKALQYMESNLCTSMAFQLAVTLAAELSSYVPESPKLYGDEHGQYDDELGGGWTIGPYNFNTRHPLHTTTNIDEGTEDQVRTRLRRLLHGFSFASVSPAQQHAQNYATLASADVLVGGNYIGTETHWQHQNPDLSAPQYQCNVANSAYRILLGMGFVIKNDYYYGFRNSDGVSNVLTMQGVALTLSLGIALAKSDVSRRAWSGIGVNQDPLSQTPIRGWVSDMSQGMIIAANVDSFMLRHINGNFSISDEINTYFGAHPGEETWGSHVCVPYPAFLQWARQFGVDMIGEYVMADGVINADTESPHILINEKNAISVSWVGAVQDSFAYLPAIFMGQCNAVPYMVPLSIEDWQTVSCGVDLVHPVPAGMMSNLSTPSIHNRYRNASRPGAVMVINKHAMRRDVPTWQVNNLQYPDPPNADFLRKLGLTDRLVLASQQNGTEVLPPQQIVEPVPQEDPVHT